MKIKTALVISMFILLIGFSMYLLFFAISINNDKANLEDDLSKAKNKITELKKITNNPEVDPAQLYAVFFSNGEYYFSRMQSSGDYFKLKDIYYLKDHPDLKSLGLSTESIKMELKKIEDNSINDTLLRANLSQMHSPEEIIIPQNNVFYYELLTKGSKVERAINVFEKGN